jgi:hypothetical protein
MFEEMTLTALRKNANVSYLGGVAKSAKMRYSYNNGTATYCLYLAPANMSGYEVCPNSKHCRAFCLNGAGRNKGDILARGFEESSINKSRIKKTKLFFENKELFMRLLIKEIERERMIAVRKGMEFSVRLNGTSDLSPEDFVLDGKNILEIFPDVQFYDYTKIPQRIALAKKYLNYDVTLSYNGYNNNICKSYLDNGGKVAVVFATKEMPKKFMGYNVENGNYDDLRYLNSPSTIIYLHYHPTANDYVNGKFVEPTTKFVVKEDDTRCEW